MKGDTVLVRKENGSGFLFSRADAKKFIAQNQGYVILEVDAESKAVRASDVEDKAVDGPRRRP